MSTNAQPLRTFARTFGGAAAAAASSAIEERPAAQVWMNVGYYRDDVDAEGNPIQVFVGVPLGIALDTQKPIDTSKTRSANLLKVQTEQNKLLASLQKAVEQLAPGEETTVNLTVQLRRVNGPLEAPVDDGTPGFELKLGV